MIQRAWFTYRTECHSFTKYSYIPFTELQNENPVPALAKMSKDGRAAALSGLYLTNVKRMDVLFSSGL